MVRHGEVSRAEQGTVSRSLYGAFASWENRKVCRLDSRGCAELMKQFGPMPLGPKVVNVYEIS